MSAQLIDGARIAETIHQETKARAAALIATGIVPGITFVRVGEDPPSQAYVRMKHRKAEELGMRSETVVLPADTTEAHLIGLIREFNQQPAIHGILVQAPMPHPISEENVFRSVAPEKDVDGLHPLNIGLLLTGAGHGFRPCTPAGVHELLIRSGIKTSGAEVVVLGRSNLVGKPMAAILCQKGGNADATVTILHSRSKEIAAHCRRADILIAAMGQAHFVKADMVKPGATVIDVGVSRVEDASQKKGYRLVGDVDFTAVSEVAGHLTPNPGGVGPMTIAMLMSNTVQAAEQAGKK